MDAGGALGGTWKGLRYQPNSHQRPKTTKEKVCKTKVEGLVDSTITRLDQVRNNGGRSQKDDSRDNRGGGGGPPLESLVGAQSKMSVPAESPPRYSPAETWGLAELLLLWRSRLLTPHQFRNGVSHAQEPHLPLFSICISQGPFRSPQRNHPKSKSPPNARFSLPALCQPATIGRLPPTYPVHVVLYLLWHVVVNDMLDVREVETLKEGRDDTWC